MRHLTHRFGRRGSFLMISLLMALTLSIIVASFVSLGTTSVKNAEANFTHHSTLNAGELGLDYATSVLDRYCMVLRDGGPIIKDGQQNQGDAVWTSSGWNLDTAKYTASKWYNGGRDVGLGNGQRARIRMVFFDLPTVFNKFRKPYIVSEVVYSARGAFSSGYTRQVAAYMKFASPYSFAMLARNVLNLNGQNVRIDSYDSNPGVWGTKPISRDLATVATLRVTDGGISGGNAKVLGYVATGGDNPLNNFGPNALISGYDSKDALGNSLFSLGKGVDASRVSMDLAASLPIFVYDNDGTAPVWDMPADGQAPDPVTGNPGDLDGAVN